MTYQPHFLLSFGGSLFGGPETWANNIRLGPPLGGTFGAITNIEGALTDLVGDIGAHMQNTASGYSNACRLEWVKFNEIDELGHYANESESNTRFLTGAERVTGATSAGLPPQVAMAVTFTTARERGRASKGRVFVPVPGVAVNTSTGRITAASHALIAPAWATFMDNLGNWPGMDWPNSPVPVVASKVGVPGPMEPITGVSVGDVFDTQRRRRAQLVESRLSAAIP